MYYRTTKIGHRDVRVDQGATTVCFSRGRQGESEAGPWELWTLESETGSPIPARCRPGDDPGGRFRAIAERPVERKFWARVLGATKIRPATKVEVEEWLSDPAHTDDIADIAYVGGQAMRAVGRNASVTLEPI